MKNCDTPFGASSMCPFFQSPRSSRSAPPIGANALIFGVVNGVLLKPWPFHEPERLVGVWHVAPGITPGPLSQGAFSYFTDRDEARAFEDIGLWDDGSVTVTGRGIPEQVPSLSVTDATAGGARIRTSRARSKPFRACNRSVSRRRSRWTAVAATTVVSKCSACSSRAE
jgi:hypothetical protein